MTRAVKHNLLIAGIGALLAYAFLSSIGCAVVPSSGARPRPVGLPPAPNVTAITYTINLPDAVLTQTLQRQYPTGIGVTPATAQQTWDFTNTYGRPNVYWGETAPPPGAYVGTGILVAPIGAIGKQQFTSADWSICPSACSWVGQFVYTRVGP